MSVEDFILDDPVCVLGYWCTLINTNGIDKLRVLLKKNFREVLDRERKGEELADELGEFQEMMREKWDRGREKYKLLGHEKYSGDSLKQLQEELIDVANYAMALFWELEEKGRR